MSDSNVMTLAELAASKAAVMNQVPDLEGLGQSPLHHADLESLAKAGPKQGGVHLCERKFLGHLTLRCNANSAEQTDTVEKILGVKLPVSALSSSESDDVSVYWISPDEWLILVPGATTYDVECEFRNQMVGHYSLVNSSGGSTVLNVSGDQVVELLKKSTPIDFHLTEFPVGKAISSVFAKSTAVICRKGETSFDLVIRRSFSDYVWLWIQDATLEYGLVAND